MALIDTGVVDVPGLADADVEIGPDFSFEDVVPDLRGRDTMGHGTHLAGIIAGRDAAWVAGDHQRRPDRFLGIAPDAGLVSVKAGAADGAVDVTQVIAAINWVIATRTPTAATSASSTCRSGPTAPRTTGRTRWRTPSNAPGAPASSWSSPPATTAGRRAG